MKPRIRLGWQVRVWKYVSSQLSVADDLWRIPVNGPGSCTVLGQLSFLGAGELPFSRSFSSLDVLTLAPLQVLAYCSCCLFIQTKLPTGIAGIFPRLTRTTQ